MPAYVFIIDNKREDGYYLYRKYPPGTELDENGNLKNKSDYAIKIGWSLCSKQDDENKKSWINAVNFYLQRSNSITLKTNILSYIENIKKLLIADEKSFPDNKSLVMPEIKSVIDIINDTNVKECNDEFISQLHSLGLMELPSLEAMAKYAWLSTKFNLNNEINKALYSLSSNISSYILPVLSTAEGIVNSYFNDIDAVYIEVKRICNKCIRIWNICKSVTDEETRKKLLTKFTEECVIIAKKCGNWIIDYLYIVLCIDSFIKVFKALTQLGRYGKNSWTNIIQELNLLCDPMLQDFFELVSNTIQKLKENMRSFIAPLSSLIGALFMMMCADEELKAKDQKRICDNNNVNNILELNDKITNNSIISTEINNIHRRTNYNSIVLQCAKNNTNKFSLVIDSKNLDDINVSNNVSMSKQMLDASVMLQNDDNCSCKVSMCDNYNPDDKDAIIKNISIFTEPIKICIELDKTLPYTINVTDNQHVKLGDVIASINNVELKSINNFIVEDVQSNYIVGTYNVDKSLTDLQNDDVETLAGEYFNNQLASFDDKDLQAMSSEMTKNYDIENFLINYISYCRYPDFASYTREHTKGNASSISTQEFIEVYENKANKFYDDFKSKMKKIAGKDNVKSKSKQGKIISLQNEIASCKSDYIHNIIQLYNENPGNLKFCSLGRISDFSLYDLYVKYINDFDYNENNIYVVKLFDLINSFIARRKRIEINSSNIKSLISAFNEVCDKYIKKYWKKTNDNDYYTEFSKIFEHDVTTTFIEPIDENINSSTLYKTVLNHLKVITKCTQFKEYQLNTDDIGDYNKFLENQSKYSDTSYDKSQIELLSHLKNIAVRFTSIKNIEISSPSLDISEYLKDDLDYSVLSSLSYKDYSDYYEGKIYCLDENTSGMSLYGYERILGGYLKTLKEITDDESRQLSELINFILSEYANSDYSIDNYIGKFNKIFGLSWPTPSLIYNDNEKCNFYFFDKNSISLSSSEELLDMENEIAEDIKMPLPDNIEYDPSFSYNKKGPSPGITSLKYWLRYCAIATMCHSSLPMYWSTGLIVLGNPIMMPVIYIPMKVITGKRVITVCGIGVCGICPLPMLLFLNLSDVKMTLLPFANIAIDMMFDMLKGLTNVPLHEINISTQSLLDAIDAQIINCRNARKDIDFQISELKRLPKSGDIIRNLGKALNKDVSYKREMNNNEFFYPRSISKAMAQNQLPKGGDPFDNDVYVSETNKLIDELKDMKFEFYTEEYYNKINRESDEAIIRKAQEQGSTNNNGGNDNYDDTYVSVTISESNGSYPRAYQIWRNFCRSWEGGWSDHPNDSGGKTYKGITYNFAYKEYCRRKNITMGSVNNFIKLIDTGNLWDEIAYTLFYKECNADKINNPWIAILLVDTYWGAPNTCLINDLNVMFGSKRNSIIARNVIEKVNNLSESESEELFTKLINIRYRWISNSTKTEFIDGWKNRLNGIKYGYVLTNEVPKKKLTLY